MDLPLSYIDGMTAIHRCDARLKIMLLLAYSIGVFFVDTWRVMALFALTPVVLAAGARIPVRAVVVPLAPVAVLAAFALAFAVAGQPNAEGFSRGALVAVRMIALVAASFVVCLTTTSSALLQAFAFFIGPSRRFGVPVDDIAFTLMLAIRFIPQVADEFTSVRKAQVSRGGDGTGLGLWRRLGVWGSAFSAVFVGLFRHADSVATAMDARCYGACAKRSSLQGHAGEEKAP